MRVVFQMDPISGLNFSTDTTIVLIEESLRRGFETWYYVPINMSISEKKVVAQCYKITGEKDLIFSDEAVVQDLNEFDILFIRQDPPFDLGYLTNTYALEKLVDTFVVNDPVGVRDVSEKMFALTNFGEFMAPTIVTENLDAVTSFVEEYKEVVFKPLYSYGGQDVYKVSISNWKKIFSDLVRKYSTPIMVQKFLPEVKEGDKRIILIEGKIAGAINRMPAKDSIKANLAAGGTAEKTTVTSREKKICSKVGKELRQRGIMLAGLDFIGGYLSEINVTSPTGFRAVNNLYNLSGTDKMEAILWNKVLDMF